jgi:aspartyl protease family protein
VADISAMISLNPSLLALLGAALLCANDNAVADGNETPAQRPFAANTAITQQPVSVIRVAEPAARAVTISKAPDGLFYVSGEINGTPIRFLVDTGANLVVLTADDARRVGLPLGDALSAGSIETAGGQSNMDRVSLDRVNVAGRQVANVDAAVMRDGLKVSLLGQNLLSRLGPITMSGDEITLQSPR